MKRLDARRRVLPQGVAVPCLDAPLEQVEIPSEAVDPRRLRRKDEEPDRAVASGLKGGAVDPGNEALAFEVLVEEVPGDAGPRPGVEIRPKNPLLGIEAGNHVLVGLVNIVQGGQWDVHQGHSRSVWRYTGL